MNTSLASQGLSPCVLLAHVCPSVLCWYERTECLALGTTEHRQASLTAPRLGVTCRMATVYVRSMQNVTHWTSLMAP